MNKQLNMSKELKIAQNEVNLLDNLAKKSVPKKSQSVQKSVVKKKVVAVKKKALAEKAPVVEEKQSKMYVDFLPSKVETPQNKPTKISLSIQLMGLVEALIPNRELLQSLIKLVKVFISIAFTLSAIYASSK